MKVAVVGGSGRIGALLVHALADHGFETRTVSPSHGVDAVTHRNLDRALAGVDVLVDLVNPPASVDPARSFDFFDTSTKNLLEAGRRAGVRHHVLLSMVGADRIHSGYFRGKYAQERRVHAAAVPHTVVRSTLSFETLSAALRSAPDAYGVRVPQVDVQPVSGRDLALRLAHHVAAEPSSSVMEVAGPERMALGELASRFLRASGDMRTVIVDPTARTWFGTRFAAGDVSLLPDLQLTGTTFAEWISSTGGPPAAARRPVMTRGA